MSERLHKIGPPLVDTEVIAVPRDGNIVPVPLRDGICLGNAPGCGICLPEPWLASLNTRFVYTPEGFVAEDLNTNGLSLRGERIDRRLLHVGDVLVAGQTPLLFQHRLGAPPWWDEAGPFLAAIRETREDDEVRLVFADWLADRDPARAEFIVCQIAAARGSAEAAARAAELECIEFAGPLAVHVESWTFERGFLGTVRILYWGTRDRLLEDHPIREVLSLDYPPPPFLR